MQSGLIENTRYASIIILLSFKSSNVKSVFEEESVSNLRKFNYAVIFLEKTMENS
jgi:hypothetical protein